MRGLTILVAGADPARFRSALTLAATSAAIGARTRLFLDAAAVTLLEPKSADERLVAQGLPAIPELIETCLELGVSMTLCQTGLALAGLEIGALDPRFECGGMTTMLAELGEDRLLAI